VAKAEGARERFSKDSTRSLDHDHFIPVALRFAPLGRWRLCVALPAFCDMPADAYSAVWGLATTRCACT